MSNNELSFKDKIIKNSLKCDLLKDYSNNTLIRSLIQIVPYGSVVDNLLSVSYNNILIERARVFYNELSRGKIELTAELIESEDFLHSYFSTYKAALYTKQREKIRLFARLLQNGLHTNIINKADEYDDYLKILNELTIREICILHVLEKFEFESPKNKNENELQRAQTFWSYFEKEIFRTMNIEPLELRGFLKRIERTGCYTEITGAFFDYSGGRGYLTQTYIKLKELIAVKDEDLVFYQNSY